MRGLRTQQAGVRLPGGHNQGSRGQATETVGRAGWLHTLFRAALTGGPGSSLHGFGAGSRAQAQPCSSHTSWSLHVTLICPVHLSWKVLSLGFSQAWSCLQESSPEFKAEFQGYLALLQIPDAMQCLGLICSEWNGAAHPSPAPSHFFKCGSVHTCTLQNQPAKSLRAHFPK